MGLKQLLQQILAELLAGSNDQIVQALKALEDSLNAQKVQLAVLDSDIQAIMTFFGTPTTPGTVTAEQIQQTVKKVQDARAVISSFNP